MKRVPTLARMHNVRAHQFLAVAEKMLDGELSYRIGDLKDAFESLRKAVRSSVRAREFQSFRLRHENITRIINTGTS